MCSNGPPVHHTVRKLRRRPALLPYLRITQVAIRDEKDLTGEPKRRGSDPTAVSPRLPHSTALLLTPHFHPETLSQVKNDFCHFAAVFFGLGDRQAPSRAWWALTLDSQPYLIASPDLLLARQGDIGSRQEAFVQA